LLIGFLGVAWVQNAQGFQFDEEDKKKAILEREKKAFDALMRKAEDEYRIFFKRPENVPQFWAAIKFELDVGKFDLAALHLKEMLALPADKADPDILKILDRESLSTFTRLQTVRLWSIHEPYQVEAAKNVQTLLERVKKTLEDHLSNPKRIAFFIENLSAKTREEREFAKAELNRSKERAVPYLVDSLRLFAGKPQGDRIMDYMVEMDEDMITPMLEIFKVPFPEPGDAKDRALRENDARDPTIRLALMDVLQKRNDIRRAKGFGDDARVVPYLWHIAGGDARSRLPYSPLVRDKAKDLLIYFLRAERDRLPRGEVALTALAERYYQKKREPGSRSSVPLWRWNSVTLASKPIVLTPEQAREVFTLRYAKEALDLAPTHQPAQLVLLSMQMDSLYRPDLGKFLLDRPVPEWKGMEDLLARVDLDLLTRTLEKAMNENATPVILGSLRALGRRGDAMAAKVVPSGPPRGVVRALDFPDRRVQWAALQAILNMPAAPPPVIRTRVLEQIKRQLLTDAQPRALAIGIPDASIPGLRAALKEMGYLGIMERDFKAGFKRLQESAEYDLVILHGNLGAGELPYYVNQLRADVDQGVMPVVVLARMVKADAITKDMEEKERLAGIFIIEGRIFNELLKKKMIIEITEKDLIERAKLYEAEDAYFAKEKDRRLKEFEETLGLSIARRRMAAGKAAAEKLERALSRQKNVTIIPEMHLGLADAFKKEVEGVLDDAYGVRMTKEERSWFQKQALGYLWYMSKGEIAGYQLASARESLIDLLRTKTTPPEQVQLTLEILGRIPGTDVQQNLAAVTLDPARDKLRIPAAMELNHHIKKYGVLLPREQLKAIKAAHGNPAEDVTLRGQYALILGAMGPSPRLTGERLFEFRPPLVAPPAPPEEKKDKKGE